MIGETLEIAIVVSTIVLIVYPSAIVLRRVALERAERRVKVRAAPRNEADNRHVGASRGVRAED